MEFVSHVQRRGLAVVLGDSFAVDDGPEPSIRIALGAARNRAELCDSPRSPCDRAQGSSVGENCVTGVVVLDCRQHRREDHGTGQQHLLETLARRAARRRLRSRPCRQDERRGDHRRRLHQRPSLQQPVCAASPTCWVEILAHTRRSGHDRGRTRSVRRADPGHAHRGVQLGVARRRGRLRGDRTLRPSRRRDDRDLRLRQDRRCCAHAARPHQRLRPGASTPAPVRRAASISNPWAAKGTNLTIMDYAEGRAANEAGRLSDDKADPARAQRDAGQRHPAAPCSPPTP